MKVKDILENDRGHQDALDQTGFWGAEAAGALILARKTGRLLIPYRSSKVQEPHTWGVWGGAIEEGESPKQGAIREVTEELGDIHILDIKKLYVFKDTNSSFRYTNFLFIVEDEFEPSPQPGSGWETDGHEWVEYGDWPSPLHFGLKALLNDSMSVKVIQSEIQSTR